MLAWCNSNEEFDILALNVHLWACNWSNGRSWVRNLKPWALSGFKRTPREEMYLERCQAKDWSVGGLRAASKREIREYSSLRCPVLSSRNVKKWALESRVAQVAQNGVSAQAKYEACYCVIRLILLDWEVRVDNVVGDTEQWRSLSGRSEINGPLMASWPDK